MENRTAEDMQKLPIGVFDSGVGGISVLRELVKQLPQEDFYFVGDDAHAPFGTKSTEEVQKLTMEQVEHMRRNGIKAVVIACNTATSAAIGMLREVYTDMPVIGIEPAVKPAVGLGDHPTVWVMATPGTVKGRKYRDLTARYDDSADIVPIGCPGLMEYVERGELSGERLDAYLQNLLAPYRDRTPDAVVLGCTHYPFVKKAIRKAVGDHPMILDGSAGTAAQTKRLLAERGWLRNDGHAGRTTFHMTLPGKEALCERLLYTQDIL